MKAEFLLHLTKVDLENAFRLHSRVTLRMRISAAVALSLIFFGIQILVYRDEPKNWTAALVVSLLFGCFAFLANGWVGSSAKAMAQTLITQQKALTKPMKVKWDDSRIIIENPDGHQSYPWVDFRKWRTDSCTVLLYLSDLMFLPIPMTDDAERARGREFVERLRSADVSGTDFGLLAAS